MTPRTRKTSEKAEHSEYQGRLRCTSTALRVPGTGTTAFHCYYLQLEDMARPSPPVDTATEFVPQASRKTFANEHSFALVPKTAR